MTAHHLNRARYMYVLTTKGRQFLRPGIRIYLILDSAINDVSSYTI